MEKNVEVSRLPKFLLNTRLAYVDFSLYLKFCTWSYSDTVHSVRENSFGNFCKQKNMCIIWISITLFLNEMGMKVPLIY